MCVPVVKVSEPLLTSSPSALLSDDPPVQPFRPLLPSSQAAQERITASQFGLKDPRLVIVGSSSHPSAQTEEFISLFNEPEIVQVRGHSAMTQKSCASGLLPK